MTSQNHYSTLIMLILAPLSLAALWPSRPAGTMPRDRAALSHRAKGHRFNGTVGGRAAATHPFRRLQRGRPRVDGHDRRRCDR